MQCPRSSLDLVREVHPDAFCRPVSVLESMPPRVQTWQVFDSSEQPLGPATNGEAQAWQLAAEELAGR